MDWLKFFKTNFLGITLGIIYGICSRLIMGKNSEIFEIMTIGFVFFVPFILGILTVGFASKPDQNF